MSYRISPEFGRERVRAERAPRQGARAAAERGGARIAVGMT